MTTGKFIIDMLVYSDEDATNDPQIRNWDYKKTFLDESLSNPSSTVRVLPNGNNQIDLPASEISWVYIETDQEIYVKFNETTDETNIVSPSTAGTSDGVFFKRGTIDDLVINVPGDTDANVIIFMGA